jgi:predicted MFS family arabinose efflux permease
LVNLPVGLAASILALRLIAPDGANRRMRLDLFGGFLITAAVGALVLGISEGPDLGWGDWTVLSGVAVCVLSFGGFVVHERHTPEPLVDFRLLRRRRLRTAATLTFLLGAWNAGELVVLSVYMQRVLHDSPLFAGLIVAPQGLAGFCAGFFGARLIGRLGLHRWLMATTAAAGVGFLVLTRLPTSGHYSPLFSAVVFIGFGTAGTMFGTNVMAASGVARRDQGLVGGVVNTTRQVGAAFGVAVLVAIAGSDPRSGAAAIGGDRGAMFVAGMAGLIGSVVAWAGSGSPLRTVSSHIRIQTIKRRTP